MNSSFKMCVLTNNSNNKANNELSEKKKIPPDGGWGWVVVAASALAKLIIASYLYCFTLIYKDKFHDLGIPNADLSFIINFHSAISMALGIINGGLLKIFGFRKLTIAGGFIYSIGIMATGPARSFTHFVITYGIIAGTGLSLVFASLYLAVNTYFEKRRGKASGVTMTIIGIGPVIFPLIVPHLLVSYGVQGTMLIMGALSLNAVVAGCLLQPVSWHLKDAKDIEIVTDIEVAPEQSPSKSICLASTVEATKVGNISEDEDDYIHETNGKYPIVYDELNTVYKTDILPPLQNSSQETDNTLSHRRTSQPISRNIQKRFTERSTSISCSEDTQPIIGQKRWFESGSADVRPAVGQKRWFESGSAETVNLGSSVGIFDEKSDSKRTLNSMGTIEEEEDQDIIEYTIQPSKRRAYKTSFNSIKEEEPLEKTTTPDLFVPEQLESTEIQKEKSKCQIFRYLVEKTVELFDLDLLKDCSYLSLMFSLSADICAEINFLGLAALIIGDLGYSMSQIGTIMSTIAFADIIIRFVSPFVGDYFKQENTTMYLYSLIIMIISKSFLLATNSFIQTMVVAVFYGIGKGVRTVYLGLVLPSHVPLEKLSTANGLLMMTNGIVLVILGPIVGAIRDVSGNYGFSILLINSITFCTFCTLTFKIIRAKKYKKNKETEQSIS